MTITVTDPSGVPTSGAGLPVIYYRKGTSGAYSSSQCSFVSGSTYNCPINNASIGGVATNDTVQYYVAAQDSANNTSVNPSTGASGLTANPPAASTPPTTPNSYNIVNAINGAKTLCSSGCDYNSLTNAGGLFEAINAGAVTANVTASLFSDLTAETGTVSLNQTTEEPAGSNFTITIQPDGNAARIISGGNSTSLINLNGADRVTIDGLNTDGNALTLRSTNASGATIRFINDASGNTVQNCTVEGANTSSSAGVIFFTTSTTTGNINNIITGNTVRDRSDTSSVPVNLIYSAGTSAAITNKNNTISNNTLRGFTATGITTTSTGNESWTISGNTIFESAAQTTTLTGISFASLGTNTITQNTIRDLNTSSSASGIVLTDARATTVSRNRIYNFPSTSGSTGTLTGIQFTGSSGNPASVTVVNNQVTIIPSFTNAQTIRGIYDFAFGGNTYNQFYNSVLIGGTGSSTSSTWACVRGTSAPTTYTATDNLCYNNRTGGTGSHFAGGDESANTGTFVSNFNFFAGTGATAANFMDYGTSSSGTPVSFATWQAGPPTRDANSTGATAASFTVGNIFVNANSGDLHLKATAPASILNAGTPIAGITTDFDGNTRDAATPDIGADEFVPPLFRTTDAIGPVFNWEDVSTWEVSINGGVTWSPATSTPTAADGAITIRTGSGTFVIINAALTVDEVTIEPSAFLRVKAGVTVNGSQITTSPGNSGGTLQVEGTLVNNGQIQIDGILEMYGGSISAPPSYGATSTLKYSGNFARGAEWTPGATSQPGYPTNVQVITSDFNLPNGTTNMPFQMSGLFFNQSGNFTLGAMTQPLIVLGNVFNGGTLRLSTAAGGNLVIGGDFDGGGTIIANGRTVIFAGTTQSLGGSGFFGLGGIQINSGSTLTLTGNVTLANDWTNNGTLNANGQTVTFNGNDNTQMISGTNTFANLTINHTGTGGVTAAGSTLNVTGTLLVQSGTFTSATAYNNVAIGAAGTLVASGPITVSGNWTNNGSFNSNGQTVTFNGNGTQMISGTGASTFTNMTVNGDITLSSNLTVTGTLDLGSHKITTGANTVFIGSAGTVARTSGYIIGTEQKTFGGTGLFTYDVGTSNGYSPVDTSVTAGTGALAVRPTQSKQPNVPGTNALSRYWTLAGAGITTDLTFHYLAADVVGSEANYRVLKYAGTFSVPAGQSVNTGAHTASVTGVNSFSDWTLADAPGIFGQLQFAQANTDTAEGNTGTHNVTITVQRTGGSGGAVSVHYATSDGTATDPSDYTATSGDLNWADGDAADKTFNVSVSGDTSNEPDETINLTLSAPTGGASLGTPASATITIQNDDAAGSPGSIQLSSATYNDDEADGINITITRTGGSDGAVAVTFDTSNGTATAGSDYTAITGQSVMFADGDAANKTVHINFNDDSEYEGPETFNVALSNPTGGATLGTPASAVVTINDNDAIPATLVVNTTNDNDDGTCNLAHCSLREAINAANTNADASTINFNIPPTDPNFAAGVFTIKPTGGNYDLSSGNVTVDGASQTTFTGDTNTAGPEIVIDGSLQNCGPFTCNGLTISSSNNNVSGLVINHFTAHGITINGGATGNIVKGCYIGTDPTGTTAAGNNAFGITSGGSNTIGGLNAGEGNLISGNGFPVGFGGLSLGSGDTVEGNKIGTNAAGTVAIPNNTIGILANTGFGHTIQGNLISGNTGAGIVFAFGAGTGSTVKGNKIGTDVTGTSAISNGAQGLQLLGGSLNNTIGGAGAGEGNVIAFNTLAGIGLDSTAGAGNRITGNSIHDNTLLGIDLGSDGVTPNDAGDPDTGPNNLQNFPVITSALVTGSTKTITGTLNSTPGQAFTIEFFANSTCDSSGNGEGQTYLGSLTTDPTDGSGNVSFTFHPTTLSAGQVVTATATDTSGNTSEFSQCVTVAGGTAGQILFTSLTYSVAENVAGGMAAITVTRTGGSDGAISATFSTADGTATAGSDYTAVSNASISYADGETGQKTVNVSITDDSVYEGNETVNLSLSTTMINGPQIPPTGGTSATLTITENDAAPTFAIDDVTHNEGNSGTTMYTFTVTKSGATALPASVDFTTVDGSATVADNDYAANSGTLNFGAADTTMQLTVLVNGDTQTESNEAFTVHLSNASGATITDADGTGTITNDDARPPANVVYVDDDFTGPVGSDPDGAGPATEIGYDAFNTIQGGVNGVATGGTVNVAAGTYDEDVAITNNGMKLLGAGAGVVNIRGPIGGPGTTVQVFSSNVTIAGFTITRLGNNTTDWNNPNLNTAGIAIQGLSITGTLIRDNIITGNRTGIDINNSGGHTVRNNVIDFNRTGFIFRNQTDGMSVVENFITNNWTVGVLFLDASGGTNSPLQQALHSGFNNNNISANWYAQIVDRQTGGSLPAPGTTNLKNFRNDWFGTTSPVVTTANSAEPGYAAQIPVAYGGTATPPGGQPDIAGPASANFKYIPFLLSGTDTNVETTPGRGTNGFQGVQPANVVVRSNNLNGWVPTASSTAAVSFVPGPATPPLGEGSAQLAVGADGDGAAQLRQTGFNGTSISDLTALSYSTYTSNDGTPPAIGDQTIYIILNVDKDADGTVDTLLFFEPEYQHGYTNAVPDQGDNVLNTWQTWNARIGGWYGIDSTNGNPVFAGAGSNVEPLNNFSTAFPNARLSTAASGSLRLVAGFGAGSWDNFVGNVDNVIVGVNTANTTYDFEPLPRLSINDVTLAEGNAGQTAFTFNVTLSSASDQTVTVDYATADNTASAPSDYTAIPTTTLTFDPGQTSKQVTVQVNGDFTLEPDETFFVNLSNVNANATILDGQGIGTIQNDDVAMVGISISDTFVAEPTSGTSTATFTVSLSAPSTQTVTVDYATADGSAVAPGDYTAIPTMQLSFMPGQVTKTINVTVNGDGLTEGNENFFVNLSNPSGNATIADPQGQGTITDPTATGQMLISEFRFRGPTFSAPQNIDGFRDEYVELYNNTNNPVTVATTDGSEGWTLAALNSGGTGADVLVTIPNGTVIPARGHLLAINSDETTTTRPNIVPEGGYSLNGYAVGDAFYVTDVSDNAGVAVFNTANVANLTATNRLDAVGFTGPVGATADTFREGAGLQSPGAVDGQYAFVRRLETGIPQDTDDNAADFVFIATDGGTYGGVQSILGAPGPENCGCLPVNQFPDHSPTQRNAQIKASLIEPQALSTVPPNRVRDAAAVGPNATFGTLELRRRFKNTTGQAVTRLRFRIVDVTTLNTPNPGGAQADLRWLSSTDMPVTTSLGMLTLRGTVIETPPTQGMGGGLNSTGVVTLPGGALASGATIDVRFVLGVQAPGRFRFFVNVEALP
ncbi:MAG: Calx-beta domain-containing protein [Pyrinomonadaceae bacterium]